MDNWNVDVVRLQPLKEAPRGMHAADARCNVQQRKHSARILQQPG